MILIQLSGRDFFNDIRSIISMVDGVFEIF